MTDCQKFLENIDAYVDGQLTPGEIPEMENHISTCKDCATLVEMTKILRESSGLLLVDPPDGLSAGVMAAIKSGAANAKPKRMWTLRLTLIASCAALAIVFYSTRMQGFVAKNAATGGSTSGGAPSTAMALPEAAADQASQIQPFAAATDGGAVAGGGGEAITDEQKDAQLENSVSVEPPLRLGGAEAPEDTDQPQLLAIEYSDEAAPMVESEEFARGYSVIMTANLPDETIQNLTFKSVQIGETTYYLTLPNEQIESFIDEISGEETVLTVYTNGMYVIPRKTEALAMLNAVS